LSTHFKFVEALRAVFGTFANNLILFYDLV